MKSFYIAMCSVAILLGFIFRPIPKSEKKTIDLPRFTAEFVQLAQQYEAECYADSSMVEYYYLRAGCVITDSTNVWHNPSDSTVTRWIHRVPTLLGFSEYLEKELKK